MTRQNIAARARLLAGSMLFASSAVSASGFALVEQSASGQGNAFAGATAAAEDASTIFFNPAGMTRLSGRNAAAGLHLIVPQSDFTNRGSTSPVGPLAGGNDDGGQTALVPNLYYLQPLTEHVVAGIGINVPFGLSTEYDAAWVGRYHGIKSEVTTININPSLAWQVNDRLSLAGGVSAQYIDVTLTTAIDLGASCFSLQAASTIPAGTCTTLGVSPQQSDGLADLSGDDWSYGFNVGLLFDLTPDSRIGFAYRSKVSQSLSGDARFSGTTAGATAFLQNVIQPSQQLVNTTIKADITLPESVSLGYFLSLNEHLAIMADWTWTHWQRFNELRVDFASLQPDGVTDESWRNSSRFSLGANYRLDDRLMLRAGIAYDETPVPDAQHRTVRIPGNDRRWLSLGFNWRFSATTSLDIGYSHLFVSKTAIDSTNSKGYEVIGSYDSAVDIVSAQLNWRY